LILSNHELRFEETAFWVQFFDAAGSINEYNGDVDVETTAEVTRIHGETHTYLTKVLLPFWIEHAPDPQFGGYLTHFDVNGKPTGDTTKTFLMQIRMLYTMASAHRAGYGGGRCAVLAQMGAEFILDHYWDNEYEGWIWVADRQGDATCLDKVGYGHCFGVYAFSEYFLATGDKRGKEAARRTYDTICRHMVDFQHGGFIELFQRDWMPLAGETSGGNRKSLDVHMHMMEALTTLYEMTGNASHRRHLVEVIDLVLARMLHPENGLGIAQFAYDFTPLPAINFDTTWGRDADPEEGRVAKPLDQTSPGHNVEFAWLLLHAADVLGVPREKYIHVLRTMCDHCTAFGIDREYGGVYADVPMDRPTNLTEKQFWQQAEALIALLDASLYLGDAQYWDAFINVYDFVFGKFVAMDAGGEWYERLDREGNILDGALAHSWKISYHTVRSMIQIEWRLRKLIERSTA
jgi:mannose/cellobiose epimerase-like protein (N-acyl-D-glucosamine 2-epimerase family)